MTDESSLDSLSVLTGANPERYPGLKAQVTAFFRESLTSLDGFEERTGQLDMALSVAHALSFQERVAIEAPTGTGKTLAYLVPLVIAALDAGRPMLIATKTLQLQHQLANNEIPRLQSLLPKPLNVVQARGWSNYLCLRRLAYPTPQAIAALGANFQDLQILADRQKGHVLHQDCHLSSSAWASIQADPLDCPRRRCPFYTQCGLFQDRRSLENAHIILTNHAFLLRDLSSRRHGYNLLPQADALVIDEAHRLETVATEQLSRSIDPSRLAFTLSAPLTGRLESARSHLLAQVPESELLDWITRFDHDIIYGLKALEDLGSDFLQHLTEIGSIQRFHELKLEAIPPVWTQELSAALHHFRTNLTSCITKAEATLSLGCPAELTNLASSLEYFHHDLDFLVKGDDPDWVFTLDPHIPALVARPITCGDILEAELFSFYRTVILTSATLRINRSFSFFFRQTGLDHAPISELVLASPFNLAKASFIGLTSEGLEPQEDGFHHSHCPPILRLVHHLRGRTLLLTTSYSSLRDYAQLLAPSLDEMGISLLMQGQASPQDLIEQFRATGAHLLLGVDTFWEGVDIPGERLSCVISTRLPFPVPTDPLFAARSRRLESQGLRAFEHLSLPLTALKLKQGFGRLLRQSSDRGIFLLLDPRIKRKAYGRSLANNLPAQHMTWAPLNELVDHAVNWAEQNL